jgi:hypothetical protein
MDKSSKTGAASLLSTSSSASDAGAAATASKLFKPSSLAARQAVIDAAKAKTPPQLTALNTPLIGASLASLTPDGSQAAAAAAAVAAVAGATAAAAAAAAAASPSNATGSAPVTLFPSTGRAVAPPAASSSSDQSRLSRVSTQRGSGREDEAVGPSWDNAGSDEAVAAEDDRLERELRARFLIDRGHMLLVQHGETMVRVRIALVPH